MTCTRVSKISLYEKKDNYSLTYMDPLFFFYMPYNMMTFLYT